MMKINSILYILILLIISSIIFFYGKTEIAEKNLIKIEKKLETAEKKLETDEKKLETTEKKLETTEKDLEIVKERLISNSRTENYLIENFIKKINFDLKNKKKCQNILFKKSHIISFSNSTQIISNLNKKLSIIDVYPNPVMLKTHSEDYSKVTFEVSEENIIKFNLDKSFNDKAIVLPYSIIIKEEKSKDCLVELEISLGEQFEDNEKWKINNIFGRSGYGPGNFSLPYGTEYVDNLFYVSDCSNENISIFSEDGEFLEYFGKFGTDVGYLDTPADIKVTDNKVYVIEERNHRVQIFDKEGNSLKVFGSFEGVRYNPELSLHKFNNPLGLAISSDTIVVVDYGNNRILGFDLDFKNKWVLHNKLNSYEDYEKNDPQNMIINFPYYAEYIPQRNQFIVTNRSGNNMLLISNKGKIIKTFGKKILKNPHEVAVSPSGDIIVANMGQHSAVIFYLESEYDTFTEIKFPSSYGYPKTVTSINDNHFRTGFVRNGAAYFVDLKKGEVANLNKNYNKENNKILENNNQSSNIDQNLFVLQNNSNDKQKIFKLYSQYCASCHESGRYNAPQRGNIESWSRFSRDLDILTDLAIKGKGAMISKGGCSECTRKDIYNIIKNILIPMNW